MKVKEIGTGEWNTVIEYAFKVIEYTFKVPFNYDREEEERQAKEEYGLKNYAMIAHLCKKYKYTTKDITRAWWE